MLIIEIFARAPHIRGPPPALASWVTALQPASPHRRQLSRSCCRVRPWLRAAKSTGFVLLIASATLGSAACLARHRHTRLTPHRLSSPHRFCCGL